MIDNINGPINDLIGRFHICNAGTFQIDISTRCPSNYAIVDRRDGKVIKRDGYWGKESYSIYSIDSKRELIKILKRSIKIDKRKNRYTKEK